MATTTTKNNIKCGYPARNLWNVIESSSLPPATTNSNNNNFVTREYLRRHRRKPCWPIRRGGVAQNRIRNFRVGAVLKKVPRWFVRGSHFPDRLICFRARNLCMPTTPGFAISRGGFSKCYPKGPTDAEASTKRVVRDSPKQDPNVNTKDPIKY